MGRLDGKKAFITGGAQGLGRCFAEMFAAEGAAVAITDVQADEVRKTAEEINQAHPGKAFAFTHDVTSKEDWETSLAGAADAMGGISVLVNNAGIGGAWANIETETWEMYRKVMDIDLDAIFVGTQLAMPYLKDNQPGSIINISSIAGVRADGNFLSYNVAKAGVRMISKSIGLHCAKAGYQITCLHANGDYRADDIENGITGRGRGQAGPSNSHEAHRGAIGYRLYGDLSGV